MAVVQPSAIPSLPAAISGAIPDAAEIRMGTVVAKGSQYLRVRIGNARVATDAAWVSSYQPILGDVVAVSRQGAAWVVLGNLGGSIAANTALSNYSFEQGALSASPPNWTLVTTAGSPTLLTTTWSLDDAIDGAQVAVVTSPSATTVTTEVVSDPFEVRPGQQWMAAGYYRTWFNFAATSCVAQLSLSWYSSNTLGSLLSSVGSGSYAVTKGMGWELIRVQGTEGYNPPLSAAYGRVRLSFTSWTAAAGDTIYLDRMIARRL